MPVQLFYDLKTLYPSKHTDNTIIGFVLGTQSHRSVGAAAQIPAISSGRITTEIKCDRDAADIACGRRSLGTKPETYKSINIKNNSHNNNNIKERQKQNTAEGRRCILKMHTPDQNKPGHPALYQQAFNQPVTIRLAISRKDVVYHPKDLDKCSDLQGPTGKSLIAPARTFRLVG